MLPGALGTKLINYLQLCFQDAKVTQFLSTESDTLAAMKSFDREVKLNGNWDRSVKVSSEFTLHRLTI